MTFAYGGRHRQVVAACIAAWLRRFALRGCRRLACRSSISIAQIVQLLLMHERRPMWTSESGDRSVSLEQTNNGLDVFHAY
jgi:hypothetical protein